MKKILVVLAAAVLVLSFAGAAFAIHAEIPAETQAIVAKGSTQLTLGGELRTRAWWRDNIAGGIGQDIGSQGWYDQRIRLTLDAQVSPNVKGFIQLEYDSSNSDKYMWGTTNWSPSNGGYVYGGKPSSTLGVLEAWIQYTGKGLFGFNSGLKIGHMPLRLGYGQFFDHTQFGDDAIVFFMDPTKELHIGLLAIKLDEWFTGSVPNKGNDAAGRFDNTNDLDGYVALLTYKLAPTHTLGFNYTYLNMSDLGFSHQNASIHANGTAGNFGYKAAFDFQFGKAGDNTSFEADFKGWQVLLALNYKLNPVNLRGMFVYSTGEDDADSEEFKEFVPYMGDIMNYAFIYEYQHRTMAFNKTGLNSPTPAGGHGAGYANTTLVNLGVDWQASKSVMLGLDGYYFWASDTGAFEDVLGRDVSKTGGWEIDLKFKYNVAKNLTYQIDLGYFNPGGFFDDTKPGSISEVKSVTSMRNALVLSF